MMTALRRRGKTSITLLLTVGIVMALLCPLSASALADIPTLDAPSILLLHLDSDTVIYSKNAHLQRAPSSLVKIMTAMVALEHTPNLEVDLTVSETAVANLTGLATAGLRAGEIMSAENLLYCLLLPSAGDAANALAESVAGDVDSFVALMNQKAQELGMTNTNFTNPHGRDDERQLTTASDMAILARHAFRNQTIVTICNTQYKRIPKTNLSSGDRYYFSNNALVISSAERRKTEDYYYSPAVGMMTGTSNAAGYNMMAIASKGDFRLLCIVLGASRDADSGEKRHYTDAIALFKWGYDNLSYTTLLKGLEPVHEVDVALSNAKDAMTLVAQEEYRAVIPSDLKPAELSRSFVLEEQLEAPVKKGDVLGRVIFSHDGIEYGSCLLVAQSDADRSAILFALDRISLFMQGRWFKITAFTVLVLAALYALLAYQVNSRRGRSHRKRRRGKPKRFR